MAQQNTPSTDQFIETLEQMPTEDVRNQFKDLFAQALAIEDAEKQQEQPPSGQQS
jgi:hypothetical protein